MGAAAEVQTFGIVLTRGNRYFYKGVCYRRLREVEVDRATRNHLVGTKHFNDIALEREEPEPIPVKTVARGTSAAKQRGGLTVRKRSDPEPGMVTNEGGSPATGGDDTFDNEIEPEFQDAADEGAVEV